MAVRLVVRHPKSATGNAGEIDFEFEQARIVIGRGPGAEIRLPGLAVSETHATIELTGDHYVLQDAGSTNGTRLNGTPLIAGRSRALEAGDEVRIAEFTLTFSDGPLTHRPTAPERTASLARRMMRELLGDESAAHEPPFLRVLEGPDAGTLLNFGEPPSRLLLGRGDEADLVLRDVDVSRAHLELVRDVDGITARDLGSKNGLDINGKRVRERRLRHGDVLRIGVTVIAYQDLAEQALRELERQPVLTLTHTQAATLGDPEPEPVPELISEQEPEPEPAADLDSNRPAGPVDLLIYALAIFVLGASAVGLVWLFR
jgi:pSer/pThr/pTyr-binding forkhead associated (FHA) protein